jgi:hypothetical protein
MLIKAASLRAAAPAFQHRMDVDSMKNQMVQGSKQDWMTWRQRDRK